MRVLAHLQVREQGNRLTESRQRIKRGHRRFQLIANAADLDHQMRRMLGDDFSAQAPDHANLPRGKRATIVLVCAWHNATASASAASARGFSVNASR
jgi:hypothetical protein